MTCYKFHVLNDTFYAVDEIGTELAGDAAVDAHARAIIADLLAEELKQQKETVHLAVMVDDPTGHRIGNYRSVTSLVTSQSPFRS